MGCGHFLKLEKNSNMSRNGAGKNILQRFPACLLNIRELKDVSPFQILDTITIRWHKFCYHKAYGPGLGRFKSKAVKGAPSRWSIIAFKQSNSTGAVQMLQ